METHNSNLGRSLFAPFSLAAGAAVLFLFFLHNRIRQSKSTRRLPPGPRGWPIIGNILQIGPSPHKNIILLQRKYGPLIWLKLGSVNTLVIASAQAAKEMFKNHDQHFCDRHRNETMIRDDGSHNGTIGLSDYGPQWKMMRRLYATELFTKKRLNDTTHLRRKCLDQLIKWVSDEAKHNPGKSIEVAKYVYAAIFNMVGDLVVSKDDLAHPEFIVTNVFFNTTADIIEVMALPNVSDFFPIVRPFDLQGLKRKTEYKEKIARKIIRTFIEERRQRGVNPQHFQEKDLLEVLLDFEGNGKDEPSKISELYLETFLLELFIAAPDATNITTEWAMSELLRKPETMNKLQAEIAQVVGHERRMEETDMENLPYLHAVIQETLRLHAPAALLIPRSVINDIEVMGYLIPKGTQVWVNTWGIGRDPTTWEDPLSFTPERFLNSNIEYRGQNFEYIPFGAGRRICPGLPLGHIMLHLVLGSLVQSFDWSLEKGITRETLDMDEKIRLTVRRANPLKVIPMQY
ncbi:cytochrome P450 76A1-like [Papaver somniferum]|uniref:cytochrome P450 76A1-like n=1 Tax=Papaver somniferum TaxID=3469 RepID=UPI000E7049C7|nr:cytochrome P450 76A1-like [Papaver somniferum]